MTVACRHATGQAKPTGAVSHGRALHVLARRLNRDQCHWNGVAMAFLYVDFMFTRP